MKDARFLIVPLKEPFLSTPFCSACLFEVERLDRFSPGLVRQLHGGGDDLLPESRVSGVLGFRDSGFSGIYRV